MSQKPASKKKHKSLLIENLLFNLFQLLVRILPLSWSLFFGKILSHTTFHLLRARHQLVINNLQRAKEAGFLANAPQVPLLARRVWEHLGMLGTEFLYYYAAPSNKQLLERVTIEGEENLQKLLAQGQGAIMATAHLGNWELTGLILASKGYQLNPIVKTQRNLSFDRFIQKKRSSIGMKVIPSNSFLRPILRALQQNEIIPFLMDQKDRHGVKVDFFGNPALFPKGTAEFAIKTKAPVFFAYIVREGRYQHRLVISDEIKFSLTGDKANDIENITKQLAKIIENTIDQYPEQWLWMHRLWT